MEYEKIIGYTGNRTEVTDDDVMAVTLADIESKIFDMLEAMSRKDVRTVLDKYYDLLASLCDLTSGSGDKGTPIIWIQNYFKNYAD